VSPSFAIADSVLDLNSAIKLNDNSQQTGKVSLGSNSSGGFNNMYLEKAQSFVDPGSSIVDLNVPLFRNSDAHHEINSTGNEEIPTSVLILHSSQDSGQKFEEHKQQSWIELLRDNPFASDDLDQ